MNDDWDIRVAVDCKNVLGEGPLWDVGQERLYWIDSFGNKVFRATVDGREMRSWDVPAKIGSLAIPDGGRSAIDSRQTGFHFLDLESGACTLLHDPEPHLPGTRINDGKVDKQGRFVAGSMDANEEGPNGALYRVDSDGSVHVLERGSVSFRAGLFGASWRSTQAVKQSPGQ